MRTETNAMELPHEPIAAGPPGGCEGDRKTDETLASGRPLTPQEAVELADIWKESRLVLNALRHLLIAQADGLSQELPEELRPMGSGGLASWLCTFSNQVPHEGSDPLSRARVDVLIDCARRLLDVERREAEVVHNLAMLSCGRTRA